MNQVNLFARPSLAEEKFLEFHKKNPRVYSQLVKLANQAHSRGKRKISIELIVNVVRWYSVLQTKGDDFKINNNYKSFYARKIMAEHPHLAGMFNTRGD
jgi:hypothetical protein